MKLPKRKFRGYTEKGGEKSARKFCEDNGIEWRKVLCIYDLKSPEDKAQLTQARKKGIISVLFEGRTQDSPFGSRVGQITVFYYFAEDVRKLLSERVVNEN